MNWVVQPEYLMEEYPEHFTVEIMKMKIQRDINHSLYWDDKKLHEEICTR